jgi:fructose 1,6-bisphosphatase
MEIDTQTVINTLLTLVGALGGWILKTMSQSITALQKRDIELADKVQEIEVLVAGDYVKKDDFDRMARDIFTLLHRIEDKLDRKADKP